MSAATITTRSGDTWDAIAKRSPLGAERYMDLMIEANPDHRYTVIFGSGVDLVAPELPDPERPSSLPPWRR